MATGRSVLCARGGAGALAPLRNPAIAPLVHHSVFEFRLARPPAVDPRRGRQARQRDHPQARDVVAQAAEGMESTFTPRTALGLVHELSTGLIAGGLQTAFLRSPCRMYGWLRRLEAWAASGLIRMYEK